MGAVKATFWWAPPTFECSGGFPGNQESTKVCPCRHTLHNVSSNSLHGTILSTPKPRFVHWIHSSFPVMLSTASLVFFASSFYSISFASPACWFSCTFLFYLLFSLSFKFWDLWEEVTMMGQRVKDTDIWDWSGRFACQIRTARLQSGRLLARWGGWWLDYGSVGRVDTCVLDKYGPEGGTGHNRIVARWGWHIETCLVVVKRYLIYSPYDSAC